MSTIYWEAAPLPSSRLVSRAQILWWQAAVLQADGEVTLECAYATRTLPVCGCGEG